MFTSRSSHESAVESTGFKCSPSAKTATSSTKAMVIDRPLASVPCRGSLFGSDEFAPTTQNTEPIEDKLRT